MDALALVILFLVFIATSLPVAIAIGLAVLSFSFLFPDDVGNISFIFQNMYSALNNFPLLAVPFFMLAGSIMETGGLSKRLVNVANQLVGNRTSGLAYVTIIACMFFGAISGSAPATVAAIGGIMMPAMVKYRYSKEFAAGLMSCAGGLGIIIPPSIPLIIYGVATSTSIGDLFLAGIFPGILVGGLLMVAAYFVGKGRGYSGTGEKFELKKFWEAFWDAKWALAMPVVILGGIYTGAFTPTEAAVVGCLMGLVVGLFIYKELTIKDLVSIMADNGALVGVTFLMFGTATSLAFLISITDLPNRISDMIAAITSNYIVVLIIINAFLLVLGMLMDPTSANLVFSSLLLSIVEPLGVNPVHFGIVVTLNLAMGFVTPPFATNVFLTSTLTGVPVPAIVKEALPFLAAMFVALVLITYVPQISMFPIMLMR
ncbi:TRAP transporter large permease, partial [Desulfovibrio sp. OttesenSCG-928-I05]|nr:TRAP transporter large permease [Desulfovibrio sp. OttesenSCG-928-I05]